MPHFCLPRIQPDSNVRSPNVIHITIMQNCRYNILYDRGKFRVCVIYAS